MRPFALLFSIPLVLSLVGCGGSSGDDDERSSDDTVVSALDGRVVDAVTGAPLGGVSIGVGDDAGGTSGADGRFELGELDLTEDPFIRFVLDGYREEFLARPTLDADGLPGINPNPTLGDGLNEPTTIRLVPDDLAGEGALAGTITDAEGATVAGATLRFLRGLFVIDGEAAATTVSGAGGDWSVVGLPYGNYTCIILIAGQDPIYQIVQVFGGVTRADQDVSVPLSATVPPMPSPADPLDPAEGEIHVELDYFSFSSYRGELLFPDGTVIDRDSSEVNSGGDIRFGRFGGSEGSFEASGFTLPLALAEGMIYRVRRPLAGPGTQISNQNMEVRVFGFEGVRAVFEPPGSRTGLWTVFRVVDAELVQILEEPEEE